MQLLSVAVIFCIACIQESLQHGFLIWPPQRGSLWRYDLNTPINYNDNALWCGGIDYFRNNSGLCGTCGDPYLGPHENEAGGKFALGIIAASYPKGTKSIEVTVRLDAFHKGYFQFKICPNNNPLEPVKQSCLDKHVVKIKEGDPSTNYQRYYPLNNGDIDLTLIFPYNLLCSQCVLQWRYVAGNSWGTNSTGHSCLGCGIQETFQNCADISIGSDVPKNQENFSVTNSLQERGKISKPDKFGKKLSKHENKKLHSERNKPKKHHSDLEAKQKHHHRASAPVSSSRAKPTTVAEPQHREAKEPKEPKEPKERITPHVGHENDKRVSEFKKPKVEKEETLEERRKETKREKRKRERERRREERRERRERKREERRQRKLERERKKHQSRSKSSRRRSRKREREERDKDEAKRSENLQRYMRQKYKSGTGGKPKIFENAEPEFDLKTKANRKSQDKHETSSKTSTSSRKGQKSEMKKDLGLLKDMIRELGDSVTEYVHPRKLCRFFKSFC